MTENPVAGFAALMSGAAREAAPDAPGEAPYGYKPDGTPKKAAGRPRKSPSVDDLKAPPGVPDPPGEDDEGGSGPSPVTAAPEPPADRPPGSRPRRGKGSRPARAQEPVPAYKAGVITLGVNKLYRRAGKIVRAMDDDIGTAIIESAKNTADDGTDDSVGAAWDELAKTNPRIRRFLLKIIAGGAWGSLVMAHAPIAMAIIMKPAILKLIPFSKIIQSMAEPDEDTPPGEGGLPGGLLYEDAMQMGSMVNAQMEKMARQMGFDGVPPEVAEQMAAFMPNGSAPPPAFQRSQPRRAEPRAARHGR